MSTDDITPIPSVDNVERLPSLDALQATHKELLRAHRQEGDIPEMLDRIESFIYQGQATGAVLDAEDDRWTAQGVLDYWSATLFRAARRAPDATLADFDPNLAPELPDELCPYVGLDPFREDTQAAFFGRERLVATLVEKLADSRLLVVSGPSGSGKSSVVLAGLLPALQRGALPGSESWRYVPRMVPGSNPLVNLVRLIEAAGDGNQEDPVAWAQQQEKLLRENPNHLLELVNSTGEAPVVGVVDQFEEAFTLCNDRQVRQAFIDNLVNLMKAPSARHTVILTMRTDFEPFVTRLPEFYALFEQAQVRVTPLSASELREAIEKPASKIGLKFEAGLVDQLLQDLLGEPAGLPLLQFTLLKLWENRTRNRITWAVYNRLGGGRLALARSADAFYDELIPEEQVTTKRIFLRLVRPGEGLEFTSNRVRLRTLYQAGEAKYRVDQVLDKLIAAHLFRVSEGDVAADTQVEVAHEALVRNWPRLVDWLEEERHNIRRRQSVSDAAERWIASGRDPGALYTTESLLQEALRVVEASNVALNEQEAEFIRVSEETQEIARLEKEAVRQREIDQAHKLVEEQLRRAEEQARAARRFRRLAGALIVLSAISAALALSAFNQSNNANKERTRVEKALRDQQAANSEQIVLLDALQAAQAEKVGSQLELLSSLETAESQRIALDTHSKTMEAQLAEDRSLPQTTPSPPLLPTASPTSTSLAMRIAETATAQAMVLGSLRNQTLETQTAVAEALQPFKPGTPTSSASTGVTPFPISALFALIPDIDVSVRAEPLPNTTALEIVRAPDRLGVIENGPNLWVKVRTPTGRTGWINGNLLTFEGDAELLPKDLSIRVLSNRDDLPFIYGVVVADVAGEPIYLLREDLKTPLVLVPVGHRVTVLVAHASKQWYFVDMLDPKQENYLWSGWISTKYVRGQK